MTAKDVACPTCAQQPGEKCCDVGITGNAIFIDIFHASRIEAAAFISGANNSNPVSVEDFNKAVEDSDLI